MSGYDLLQFVHVLSAAAWIGGGLAIFVLQGRLQAAGDRGGLLSVGRQMEGMGKQYFGSLAAVTLLTGVTMVATTEGLSFGDAWILVGLGGVAISMGIGFAGFTPAGRKMLEEAQKPQPDPAAMAAIAGRLRMLSIVNLLILTVAVWAMVTKVGV